MFDRASLEAAFLEGEHEGFGGGRKPGPLVDAFLSAYYSLGDW
jgi:hypothetical protein